MADADAQSQEVTAKRSRAPILLSLALAIGGALSGYALIATGILSIGTNEAKKTQYVSDEIAFIPVDQMTISIGSPISQRFLRFRAELEVAADYEEDVKKLMPRVVDVLNTYLRSVDLADMEDPSSLLMLRSQMRRRIDLIVGGEKVRDLLIMEFVVN